MHSFRTKALRQSLLLSELFQRQREQLRLTLQQCADKLSIQQKYLAALEEPHGKLPGQVYARSWIRKYAEFLGLTADDCWQQYQREQGLIQNLESPIEVKKKDTIWTQLLQAKVLRNGAIAVSALAILIYIGWSIYQTFQPPTITFDKPLQDQKTPEAAIVISGSSVPGAQVWFNDKLVIVDEQGHFHQDVPLATGLNILKIRAKTKHSRSWEQTVQIVKTDTVGINNTGTATVGTN